MEFLPTSGAAERHFDVWVPVLFVPHALLSYKQKKAMYTHTRIGVGCTLLLAVKRHGGCKTLRNTAMHQ